MECGAHRRKCTTFNCRTPKPGAAATADSKREWLCPASGRGYNNMEWRQSCHKCGLARAGDTPLVAAKKTQRKRSSSGIRSGPPVQPSRATALKTAETSEAMSDAAAPIGMAAPGPGKGPANEQEKKAAAKSDKEQLQAKLNGLNATIASLHALAATDKDVEQLLQKRTAERDRVKECIKEHEPMHAQVAAAPRHRDAANRCHETAKQEEEALATLHVAKQKEVADTQRELTSPRQPWTD